MRHAPESNTVIIETALIPRATTDLQVVEKVEVREFSILRSADEVFVIVISTGRLQVAPLAAVSGEHVQPSENEAGRRNNAAAEVFERFKVCHLITFAAFMVS